MTVSMRRRGVALLAVVGMVVATVAVALVTAAPASAVTHVGKMPGQMSFSQQSGGHDDQPTWISATVCPAPFNDGAQAVIMTPDGSNFNPVGNANPDVKTAPFSSNIDFAMGLYVDFGITLPNIWYEWVVDCQDPNLNPDLEQSMWVKWNADGSWTSTQTAPSDTAVATTTSLAASNANPASGEEITLTATVTAASGSPAGSVGFFDNGVSLGAAVPLSGGTATMPFSSTVAGPHSLTATFTPTDPAAFSPSTSTPVTVTVGGGGGGGTPVGSETINVNIPQQGEGDLTVTVDQTPVNLGTAQANGNVLEATGNLSPVTVNDARNTSKPGWSVSGQVSDFTGGSNTIDGNSLGWTPAITTPNPANDVTAGTAVAPGTNPGLKQGSGLANAAATHGVGQSVLGAGLDLQVPTTTSAGAYSATLTITVINTAP